MKDYKGLGINNNVVVDGFCEQATFVKGYGKFKKKKKIQIQPTDDKWDVIGKMDEEGWTLVNICPICK